MTGYQLYRNNSKLADLSGLVLLYIDNSVTQETTYAYQVRARDAAGNWSALSAAVTAKLPSADQTVLMWSNPTARENGDYLELNEIGGYEIRYKRTTDATYSSTVINNNYTNSFSMPKLTGTYVFEIAAFDSNGLYSAFVQIQPK